MSQRRTLILVAAICIGALSSFLVWNYVNGVEDDALDGAEQVPVYLVKQTIPRSTPGLEAQAYIAQENIPRKFKPANAITNPEDLAGQVALNDLVVNQVVVTDMFVDASDPSARQSFAERLTKVRNTDQVAITLSLDQVRGVAGLMRPGDYVNIMVTQVAQVGVSEGELAPEPPEGAGADVLFAQQARTLYQKVEILAVGQEAAALAGSSTPDPAAATEGAAAAPAVPTDSGLITLIVPAKAAQYIASVPPAQIYMILVARDYEPTPQDPIDLTDLLPGEDPDQLTPYGKEGPESGA